MPVYPANMKSVVDESTCKYLAEKNWFYTLHRFGVDAVKFTDTMARLGLVSSISVGVKQDSIDLIRQFRYSGLYPDYITIDVANAWSSQVDCMTKFIKDNLPESFLIIGNVATGEAVETLESWGADAIKVGISGGHSCITSGKTGFYRPMVDALLECSAVATKPIIADGGIRCGGDISKALSCGASAVMAGFLFAGFDQSAGDIVEIDGAQYKEYFGSASEYNKEEKKHIEGKKILIPYKGDMSKLLQELHEDLQSAISYAGGNDLKAFDNVEMVQVIP